jgi:hypothetical protein
MVENIADYLNLAMFYKLPVNTNQVVLLQLTVGPENYG